MKISNRVEPYFPKSDNYNVFPTITDYETVASRDIRERIESAKERDRLWDMRFHLMHVNYWVDTVHEDDDDEDDHDVVDDDDPEKEPGVLIPCEIALLEPSLRDGIREVFCQLIDPGEPPRGFRADMKLHSDKTHKVWLDNEALSLEYEAIVDKMKAVLTARRRDGERAAGEGIDVMPSRGSRFESVRAAIAQKEAERKARKGADQFLPVYVMPKNSKICARSMKWLFKEANEVISYYNRRTDRVGQWAL